MRRPARPHIVLLGGDGALSGVPRHIRDVARTLAGDHRITVFHDENRGGYDFTAQTPGVESITMAGLASHMRPGRARATLQDLRARLADLKPDLIWAHARMPVLLSRVLNARGHLPAPLMITYHGLPFEPGHKPRRAALSRWLEAGLLRAGPPCRLIFLSEEARGRFVSALPRSSARHTRRVLGNSTGLKPLPPAPPHEGPLRLVMTGRDSWQKHLEAAARILGHLPPGTAQLHMCGTGTETAAFRARMEAQMPGPARPYLDCMGPVRDVRPLLAQADLYLLTSRYEGLPIGALEAFCAGLPLALPRAGWSTEIARHHPVSLAYEPGDLKAAATAIVQLAARARADRLATRARIQAAWSAQYAYGRWQDALRHEITATLADGPGTRDPASDPV